MFLEFTFPSRSKTGTIRKHVDTCGGHVQAIQYSNRKLCLNYVQLKFGKLEAGNYSQNS